MRKYPEISLAEEEALRKAAPLLLASLRELPRDMLWDIIQGDGAAMAVLKAYAEVALSMRQEQE